MHNTESGLGRLLEIAFSKWKTLNTKCERTEKDIETV